MSKKFNNIIFATIIILFSIQNAKAAYNPYDQNGPYGTNCTWYTWQKAYEIGGVTLAPFGNAKEWYNDAKNSGYAVGSTPQANSIIVWGQWTEYGHVGYIESVSGDTMYIWDSSRTCSVETDEYNACIKADADIGLLHEGTYYKCEPLKTPTSCQYKINERYTTGYIYLNEPRQTPQFNNNANNNNYVETKKSSNNYLSELNISNLEVDFDKDKLEYSFEVGNEIEEIIISAKTEDEKSKIDGIGTLPLKLGNNVFIIKVTAEDDSTKEYKISIIKKSSNNYLSELNISNLEIDFDKDKLNYSFEVENEIEEITVSAKTEDKKAKIDGIGTLSLQVGENHFTIKVIAENHNIKEYNLSITRKEKIGTEQQAKTKNNNYVFFIYIGIVFILIAIIIIIAFHKNSKNKKDIIKNNDSENKDKEKTKKNIN